MMRARFTLLVQRLLSSVLVASLLATSLETSLQAGNVVASPETNAGASTGGFAIAAVSRLVEQAVLPDSSFTLNPTGPIFLLSNLKISDFAQRGQSGSVPQNLTGSMPQNLTGAMPHILSVRSVDAGAPAFLERAREAGFTGVREINSGKVPEISKLPSGLPADASRRIQTLESVRRALEPFKAEGIRRMPLETLEGHARKIWENQRTSGIKTIVGFPTNIEFRKSNGHISSVDPRVFILDANFNRRPVIETGDISVAGLRGNLLLPSKACIEKSNLSRGPPAPEEIRHQNRKKHEVQGVRRAQTTAMVVSPVMTVFSLGYSRVGTQAFKDRAFAVPPALLAVHFAIVFAFWTSRFHYYPRLTTQGRRAFIAAFDGSRWLWAGTVASALALWAIKGLPSTADPERLTKMLLWFIFGLPWALFTLGEAAHHFFYRVVVNNGEGDTGKSGFSNRVGGNIGRQLARMKAVWKRTTNAEKKSGL